MTKTPLAGTEKMEVVSCLLSDIGLRLLAEGYSKGPLGLKDRPWEEL